MGFLGQLYKLAFLHFNFAFPAKQILAWTDCSEFWQQSLIVD